MADSHVLCAGAARKMLFILAAAMLLLISACDVNLYSDLVEQDANEMVAALSTNGIKAAKHSAGKGLWYVTVDEALLPQSLDVLAASGLPRAVYQDMGGVFKKDSMVSTPTEEQARLVYAISQELAGTIATLDGVLAARVHLVLPELDNFGNKISPSTASVFIKHAADADLTPQVTQIKRLVENSVRDLKYESISVFLFASTAPPPLPVPPRVNVLGFSVEPENEGRAWLLAGLAFLVLALGGAYGARRVMARKKSA
ncbi:type III secretion inner membrane ring lipoprotein SctJ [Desulfovibrio sp. OttesenSCG-928-F20]|nr:type III secretion inner membrane ring lipoprotein SctJ [Desulfovibrio sp. OttesenSCG-928-F20]